jgi:hypothetical protein
MIESNRLIRPHVTYCFPRLRFSQLADFARRRPRRPGEKSRLERANPATGRPYGFRYHWQASSALLDPRQRRKCQQYNAANRPPPQDDAVAVAARLARAAYVVSQLKRWKELATPVLERTVVGSGRPGDPAERKGHGIVAVGYARH